MTRVRRGALGIAVALLAACVVLVPAASAADIVLPFTNYKVSGSLTVKKLNQSITLPDGTGCGLLGPTLGTLLSGPGNAYHLELAPPS
jgi:hypothetical protein